MDVLRETEKLPHFEQRIIMKVTRLNGENNHAQNGGGLPKNTGVPDTDFEVLAPPLKSNPEKDDNFFV